MIEIPHFAFPFHFHDHGLGGFRAHEREQGSEDEIGDCVAVITSYVVGERIDLPSFGIPEQVFLEAHTDSSDIESAVATWEPRARVLVEQAPDKYDELINRVRVNVHPRSI